MKRLEKEINIKYTYDPAHKGAPYTIDGEHYMNGGDITEIGTKSALGFECKKDGNTPYDKGSDIEEISASVKSSKATVVNMILGDTMETSMDVFFANVHSTQFIYSILIENMVTMYFMNPAEFREFLTEWAKLNERGYMRLKATSGKMIKWLEERVA